MAEAEISTPDKAELERLHVELNALRARERHLIETSFATKMDALGRLAGGVAHSFNNALLLIYGYTDFMLNRVPPGGAFHRYLAEVKAAGEHAAALARQLMTLSGKRVFQPVVMNLNGVVKQVEPRVREMVGERIACELSLAAERCLVRIEPQEIETTLLNMARNAREAMPDGGTLTISTAVRDVTDDVCTHPPLRPGRFVVLTVSDTGSGMDDDSRVHAFEPFYTTKDSVTHDGMGLFSAYAVVRQSNGAIACDSRTGKGTAFTIYLPLATAATLRCPAAGAPPKRSMEHQRVLLVDDDDKVRDLLHELLTLQGFDVLEAASGDMALALLDDDEPGIDLLIADVIMPGMDGYTLSIHVRDRLGDVPVIYMSGYTENDQLRESVQTAQAEFLQKPFTPAEFIEKVKQLVVEPAT